MNELDRIRELLDQAPPSAEVIGEGRRRIASGSAGPRRRRAPWFRPVAGLAAAALAAAVAITLALTAGSPGGTGGHVAPPPSAAQTRAATELAYRVAAAAARQPQIRHGQWVYRKYLSKYVTEDYSAHTTQYWTTADSLRAAYTSAGKVHFFGGLASLGLTAVPVKKVHGTWVLLGFNQLPVSYSHLASVPHNPRALDSYLADLLPPVVGPAGDRAFIGIDTLLTAYAMPPALTAEFYRALGDIPGVTIDTHAVDVAGRPGVAFLPAKPVALGATPEIIVNPRTYRLMAVEVVIPRAAGTPGGTEGTAILKEALVSGPGVLP